MDIPNRVRFIFKFRARSKTGTTLFVYQNEATGEESAFAKALGTGKRRPDVIGGRYDVDTTEGGKYQIPGTRIGLIDNEAKLQEWKAIDEAFRLREARDKAERGAAKRSEEALFSRLRELRSAYLNSGPTERALLLARVIEFVTTGKEG